MLMVVIVRPLELHSIFIVSTISNEIRKSHEPTHLGFLAHMCTNEQVKHCLGQSSSPGRRQFIILANPDLLSIGTQERNLSYRKDLSIYH